MENNSGTHPPFFSRQLTLQNLRNINFPVVFSILDGGPRKVNDLLTSPSNQFRDYHTWNRIEKLMPLNRNFAPQTLKTLQKTTSFFSNLDFLTKYDFPKILDLSMDFPRIFHGFSMNFRGGRRNRARVCSSTCFGILWDSDGNKI